MNKDLTVRKNVIRCVSINKRVYVYALLYLRPVSHKVQKHEEGSNSEGLYTQKPKTREA
jgi:hypothetical protein